MENGSDLRNRVLILEQRLTTQAESLQQLVSILQGVASELTLIASCMNAAQIFQRHGQEIDVSELAEWQDRLFKLQDTLQKLGKP